MVNDLYLHLLMAAAVLLLLLFGITLGFAYLLKKLRAKDAEKLQAILQAEENERSNIARELHDKLGPILSIAQLQLGYLREDPSEHNARTLTPYLHQQLTEAVQLSRDLSHQLSPLHCSEDFKAALKAHIQQIHASQQLRIELVWQPEFKVDQNQLNSLHRILQELLNNTLKHAQAKNVRISVSCDHNYTQLNYSDDGIGISPQSLYRGLGTRNIQSRVKALNGRLHWSHLPSKLQLQILLPITRI